MTDSISTGSEVRCSLDLARDRISVAIQDARQAMKATLNRVRFAHEEVELSLQVE